MLKVEQLAALTAVAQQVQRARKCFPLAQKAQKKLNRVH